MACLVAVGVTKTLVVAQKVGPVAVKVADGARELVEKNKCLLQREIQSGFGSFYRD